jgi:hypothetical protein
MISSYKINTWDYLNEGFPDGEDDVDEEILDCIEKSIDWDIISVEYPNPKDLANEILKLHKIWKPIHIKMKS